MTFSFLNDETRKATGRAASALRRLLRENSKTFSTLTRELERGKRTPILHNLEGSALAFVASCLQEEMKRPLLILTAGLERAEELTDDLDFFGIPSVFHYPKWEILPYDDEDLSLEVTSKHLDVFDQLARIRQGDRAARQAAFVAPVDALMQRVLPTDELEDLTVRFAWGERIDVEKLIVALDRAGYERVGLVESRGEFSVRSSIVDLYPPNTDDPIRLDLFGDEIESIRKFDVSTQRSLDDLGTDAVVSIPACRLKHQIDDRLRAGEALSTLFDLLPEDILVLLDSPERYEEVCSYFQSAVERQYHEILHGNSELGPPDKLIMEGDEVLKRIRGLHHAEHTRLPASEVDQPEKEMLFRTGGFSATSGDLESWITQIRRRQGEDFLVVIACDNEGQVQRFDELLREHGLGSQSLTTAEEARSFSLRNAVEGYPEILLVVGGVHDGFVFHGARIALITDREIFGRYRRRHVYKKIYKGRPIAGSNDIQRGDYVVHVEHGVGQYMGMRQQQMDGRTVDLLEIHYADGDKLLVPVDKIRYVQKYASAETDNVKLDRLGTGKWQKRRKKSREEIERMAEALLELYARREVARRDPFQSDTPHLHEFEASFPWQETPDQIQAIHDVKQDMERYRPMDRLVCGDVGYGKTEVAIRAVFKCVEEGRQAAVLVPTTILALQHFRNFKERYADYPLRVELLSRFQKPKEAGDTKKRLKSGEVHVVIGTHKLLGKDIQFANLGLLVVDEEQRFGVKAKERLKELRAEMDILTLTATPIPRTLHMAMAGLRDLSLITTPPPDRHPIKTRIIHWEEEPIAEAILRELNRGGQVFFIHNRVHNIDDVADRIRKIVPHARIGVAHGQMKESELEDHMLKFIRGEYDILVSTTIVESGIDIPNANTIIINRADAFGLAQLYQLRGRVGREKRRAYAYLIVPHGQGITEQAVKRLAAIEEFTELGSGFNIAMRDMEIRGAGNLLGKEQHGIVNEIGFELYCEMLQDAVGKLRGDVVHDQHDVEIKWPLSCYIPAPYVPVETQRVNFYKRIAMMHRQEDVEDLASEFRDRYGDIPPPAIALLEVTRMRLAAAAVRVSLIDGTTPLVRMTISAERFAAVSEHLEPAGAKTGGVANSRAEGRTRIVIKPENDDDLQRVIAVRDYLNNLAERSGLVEGTSNQVSVPSAS